MEVELVVARFDEPLGWLRKVPGPVAVTIYDKGPEDGSLVLRPRRATPVARHSLANLGFEAHSYLTHLVRRYDSLAPVTVFCQGHPFDHAADFHPVVRGLAMAAPPAPDFRWLGFIIDSDDARGRRLFVPWSKNRDGRELELDRFHRELFGEPGPPWFRFYPGAQFVLSAAGARRRTQAFYQRALALSTSFPDAGHCFERMWDRVFGVDGVDPALLRGEAVRYLKPIRRLMTATDHLPGPPRSGKISR